MKAMQSTLLRREIERELDMHTFPKLAAITCDIEPDFGGRTGTTELLENPEYAKQLLRWCKNYSVPLTGFVTTSLLEKRLPGINEFTDNGIELHPHSSTHDIKIYRTHSAEEIARSQEEWTNFFGAPAKGYRAPQGVVRSDDVKALTENGFIFDASIFPSHRHRVFDYRALPRTPWIWKGGVIELPFAATEDRSRLTLSTIKLHGENYWKKRIKTLPPVVIIDTHLHDLVQPTAAKGLPLLMRMAYYRNRTRGFELLEWLVDTLKKGGYRFTTTQDIASHNQ